MFSSTSAEDVPEVTRRAKPACETPGCSVSCSNAYSCHEQRMGRARVLAWPLVALIIVVVIGISL